MTSAFIPEYEADNVLVGVARMFLAPYKPAEDADEALLPEDTVELSGTWPTQWDAMGATDSGLEFEFSRKTNEIMIEEQVIPVEEVTESVTFAMNVTLAEDTLETMRRAYGGGTITDTAAASGTPGIRTLKISSEMENFAFGFEVRNEAGFWRRYRVPKVKSVANVKTSFVRAKDKRMYEVQFKSLCAPEDVEIREKTAEPTG